MNKRDSKKFIRYLDGWMKRLRLGNWNVLLRGYERDQLPPEVSGQGLRGGQLDVYFKQGEAMVHVAESVNGDTPEEILHHELTHLRLAEMQRAFQRTKAHLAPEVWAVIEAEYDDAEERAVEALSGAMIELSEE